MTIVSCDILKEGKTWCKGEDEIGNKVYLKVVTKSKIVHGS